jgi:hypothetical protein
VTEAAFGQAESVPRCEVEISDAHSPRGFQGRLGILVRMLVELVAEGNSAQSEAKFRLEDLLSAIWHGVRPFR